MEMNRDRSIVFLIIWLVWVSVSSVNADDAAITSMDFTVAAEDAIVRKLPVMILFINDDCENCSIAKEEFVVPMQISGDYRNKVIFRIVNLDDDKIRDFGGEMISVEAFVSRYNLELTPTASFLDAEGHELGPSVSGMSNVDYYGGLLDEAIEVALRKLRGVEP